MRDQQFPIEVVEIGFIVTGIENDIPIENDVQINSTGAISYRRDSPDYFLDFL